MKKVYTLTFFTILLLHLAIAQQTLNKTIIHNGLNREYIVYIPDICNGTYAAPLLFNFHGYGGFANSYIDFADMRSTADTAGFILVYPQGSSYGSKETYWEIGDRHEKGGADDLGFVEAMIEALASENKIDLERVYSCGTSNGGYFSFEIACQLSGRIAAVVSVAGSMATYAYENCNPTHPTPVATIHGTADSSVYYDGGGPWDPVPLSKVNSYWVNYNNTNHSPVISKLPNIDPFDGSTVEHITYNKGDSCTSVEHYKIVGGGHWYWPGTTGNMDINANSVIWNFLSKYNIYGSIDCKENTNNESNIREKEIRVYPNPVAKLLTVEINGLGNREYQLYSSLGGIILSGTISSNHKTVDLSGLPNSMYLLKIDDKIIKLIKTD